MRLGDGGFAGFVEALDIGDSTLRSSLVMIFVRAVEFDACFLAFRAAFTTDSAGCCGSWDRADALRARVRLAVPVSAKTTKPRNKSLHIISMASPLYS